MPRSALTLKLNATAHSLGDAYYRLQTNASRSGSGFDAECLASARLYESALETLREHLLTLETGDETNALIEATDNYLVLVRKDLAYHEKDHSPAG